jgi:hypothetical protein
VLHLSSSVLNFGNVEISSTDSLVLEISNTGTQDLTVDITDLAGGGFSKDTLAEAHVISPGSSTEMKVYFSPADIMEYTATFRVESDDRDIEITCFGNGVPPMGTQPTSLVIAGGGDIGQNWEYFNSNTIPSTNQAYSVLGYGRYYGDTRIAYLNPIGFQDWDGDGVDDQIVDIDSVTQDTLYATLQSLIDEDNDMYPNVVFFAGHGYSGEIDINGNAADNVTISQFDQWLIDANLTTHTPLIVLFEACFSGGFIPTVAGENRIVIGACREDQFADYLNGQCFSTRFWEEIWYGNSVWDAFNIAANWSNVFLNEQEPQLDADGDGIANEEDDQAIADTLYIGGVYQHGAVLPEIVEAPEFVNSEDGQVEIWVRCNRNLDRVWCVLYPKEYAGEPAVDQLPRLELVQGENFSYTGRFESIEPFSEDEDLEAIVYGVADLYNTIVPYIVPVFPAPITAVNERLVPDRTELKSCYPNPFNTTVSIRFQIASENSMDIRVYDVQGRLVRRLLNQKILPGEYVYHWNGLDDQGQIQASGIYIIQMHAGDYSASRKVTLLK